MQEKLLIKILITVMATAIIWVLTKNNNLNNLKLNTSQVNIQPVSQLPQSPQNIQYMPTNIPNVATPLYPHPTTYPISRDIVREYDYNKIADPLEDPVRRVARHELMPAVMRRSIDYPTRGYPDNFTQQGVLIKMRSRKNNKEEEEENKENKDNKDNNNKLLRLFGRQEYPGSNKYEYYVLVSSGNDLIKIGLDNKNNKELYCGDNIYISELNEDYRVKLHKYDAPKYYPDIL